MSKARLLLVEDEPGLILTLSDRLRAEGYELSVESEGESAFRRALAGGFDLLLLDVMLPGKDGFEICRDLRARGSTLPILMLTARSEVTDRVVGLKLGADDYLTKPFENAELLARVEALLRRSRGAAMPAPAAVAASEPPPLAEVSADSAKILDFGDFVVDFDRAEVRRADGGVSALSAQEYKLLDYLIARRGRIVTRAQLLEGVWGYTDEVDTRTVDVHVAWLRKKLGGAAEGSSSRHIETLRGLGYRFKG